MLSYALMQTLSSQMKCVPYFVRSTRTFASLTLPMRRIIAIFRNRPVLNSRWCFRGYLELLDLFDVLPLILSGIFGAGY